MTRWRGALVALLAAACGSGKSERATKDEAAIRPIDAATFPAAPPRPAPHATLPPRSYSTRVNAESIKLGELLFRDARLSSNGKLSCASCHDPARGFTRGQRVTTAAGKLSPRRPYPLINIAWQTAALGWDGRYPTFVEHLDAHFETQLGDPIDEALVRVGSEAEYRVRAARFGEEVWPNREDARTALEAYVLTRYEPEAPWDRAEQNAEFPAELKAGYQLFTTKARCALCHPPPLYTDQRYHRLGLIASPDEGRGRVEPADKGAFKTPTLRGAARREAFFHDASASSLDAAIDWHLAGGTGQGADPSIIDPALVKVSLTPTERAALGAFVRALTAP